MTPRFTLDSAKLRSSSWLLIGSVIELATEPNEMAQRSAMMTMTNLFVFISLLRLGFSWWT
jgi:hypothetical protein